VASFFFFPLFILGSALPHQPSLLFSSSSLFFFFPFTDGLVSQCRPEGDPPPFFFSPWRSTPEGWATCSPPFPPPFCTSTRLSLFDGKVKNLPSPFFLFSPPPQADRKTARRCCGPLFFLHNTSGLSHGNSVAFVVLLFFFFPFSSFFPD